MTAHFPSPMQRSYGEAFASFRAAGARVRLGDLRQQGSAKLLLPHVGAVPEVVFLNTSGGITGGDRLRYGLDLGADVRAVATTQTAERAYRASAGVGRGEGALTVGAGGGVGGVWVAAGLPPGGGEVVGGLCLWGGAGGPLPRWFWFGTGQRMRLVRCGKCWIRQGCRLRPRVGMASWWCGCWPRMAGPCVNKSCGCWGCCAKAAPCPASCKSRRVR